MLGQNHPSIQSYLEFLLAALKAEYNNWGNTEAIYGVLRQNLDKLDTNFGRILVQLAEATVAHMDYAYQREYIASLIGNLCLHIYQFPLGSKADRLEIAIAGYQFVLRQGKHNPPKWAQTQNNLANAYCNRIRGERAANLEQAIKCYQAALQVRTRKAYPKQWARTQNNLATAYFDRIRGKRAANLEQAIQCYQAALQIYTREAYPEDWAMTQNNLANAYLYRIRGERAANLEQAIECSQAALLVYTREAYPEQWAREQWARTLNNLAIAYNNRIRGERAANLEQAIECYQAALQVYTREAYPEDWAMTQNNLATAYRNRIRGESAANLERAIKCSQAALQVYTREAYPEDWAMTQNNLANAYSDRIRGERAANLERAIKCYQAALLVRTREAYPEKWAMTQNNLAIAYFDSIRGERAANLEQAIKCYQAALQVYTREAYPQNHAETLFGLGLAYRDLGALEDAAATFAAAIKTVEEMRSGIIMGGEADRQRLAAEWDGLYRKMVEVCLEMADFAPAMVYAERTKARNLVELIAATRLKPEPVPDDVWEEYQGLLQQWRNLLENQFVASKGEAPAPRDNSSYPESDRAGASPLQGELRQQIDDFIAREITPLDGKFRFGQEVEPITWAAIRQLPKANEAIIQWYFTEEEIIAFIVTRNAEQPQVVRVGGLAALEQLTTEYKDHYIQCCNNDNLEPWKEQLTPRLQRLGEILHLEEIIAHLPKDCQGLILVPYRYLHLFPLHALPLGEDNYLIDAYSQGVRYVPSCQIWQLSQQFDSGEGNLEDLFAVQNPTGDLHSADMEVEIIQGAFNRGVVLRREQATKSALTEKAVELTSARVAHFACHGYFNFDDPRTSGLVLADAEVEGEKSVGAIRESPLQKVGGEGQKSRRIRSWRGEYEAGKCFTLPEIFNLRFRQCFLVALSACETGIPDITNATDEYISILAGFMFAGARHVLGSLWVVNDVSTSLLNIRFYETILGKNPPPVAVALRATQAWLRGSTAADLLKWVDDCQLIDASRKEGIKRGIKFGRKLDYKPFKSPYHWAAFGAMGL
ncbi:MAG TPA: tetratricopeptide repeat protein [Oscillatoriaceae cyanobacterium M33_DOE_052]|nr:tetratricopeptide repeat protein [Oscillatoriaceae cyanobacterium M33_DOE_052]